MAHFYATVQGNWGRISRTGSKASGLSASINGRNIGADIEISYNQEKDRDEVSVFKTSGSSQRGRKFMFKFTVPPGQERRPHE